MANKIIILGEVGVTDEYAASIVFAFGIALARVNAFSSRF